MKKMLTMLVLAATVISGANAWQIELKTGGTNTMIAPPAVDYSYSRQIRARTATNAVTVGELRRSGSDTIICAVAGTTATNVTYTSWQTGNVAVAEAVALWAETNGIAVVTNTIVTVEPLVVPETGLTAADGTVYWFKVPKSRKALILQPSTLTANAVVSYEDTRGDVVLEDTVRDRVELTGFNGALYGHASDTGCVVNVFCIP